MRLHLSDLNMDVDFPDGMSQDAMSAAIMKNRPSLVQQAVQNGNVAGDPANKGVNIFSGEQLLAQRPSTADAMSRFQSETTPEALSARTGFGSPNLPSAPITPPQKFQAALPQAARQAQLQVNPNLPLPPPTGLPLPSGSYGNGLGSDLADLGGQAWNATGIPAGFEALRHLPIPGVFSEEIPGMQPMQPVSVSDLDIAMNLTPELTQFGRGVGQTMGLGSRLGGDIGAGVGQFAGGMATPTNALIGAGFGGLGMLGEAPGLLGSAARLGSRAISGGFAGTMAAQGLPQFWQGITQGDPQLATQGALTAGLGGLAASHALSGLPGAIADRFSPADDLRPDVAEYGRGLGGEPEMRGEIAPNPAISTPTAPENIAALPGIPNVQYRPADLERLRQALQPIPAPQIPHEEAIPSEIRTSPDLEKGETVAPIQEPRPAGQDTGIVQVGQDQAGALPGVRAEQQGLATAGAPPSEKGIFPERQLAPQEQLTPEVAPERPAPTTTVPQQPGAEATPIPQEVQHDNGALQRAEATVAQRQSEGWTLTGQDGPRLLMRKGAVSDYIDENGNTHVTSHAVASRMFNQGGIETPVVNRSRSGKLMMGFDPTGGRFDESKPLIDLPAVSDRLKNILGITDVKEGVSSAGSIARRVYSEMRDMLSPAGADDAAGRQARITRAESALLAQKWEQTQAAMKPLAAAFDKLPEANRLDFIDRMEKGLPQPTPELEGAAKVLRDALDTTREEVRSLGTGALQNFIENYFPHIWTDPAKAGEVFGRRPLEGSKAFLKQRSIPTTADGIAAGLEPLTTNPVGLAVTKIYEMNRYIMGQRIFAQMKTDGLAKFVRDIKPPEGYAPINDKIAKVWEVRPTVKANGEEGAPEFISRGQWVAPDGAARVLNNHLSPGLRGKAWFDVASGINNAMNQASLGLSAFHLTGTAINAMMSQAALGLRELSGGKVLPAAGHLARFATAPLEYMLQGNKVLQEYMRPGTHGGDIGAIVNALVEAGGRVSLDKMYRTNAIDGMTNAFKQGRLLGGVLRLPFAALEMAAKPTMEIVVPRIKLGAFLDMARSELSRLPEDATLDQGRKVLSEAWDSIDNRFGQLVYDNLFWNKTLRDALHIGVRSLGWTGGTIRELGGAGQDVLNTVGRVRSGEPLLSHRMAYAITLPTVTAMLGAVYGYLHGHPPQSLQEYMQPKDSEGQPVNLPTYMKDVESYSKRPVDTLKGKISPLASAIAGTLANKDFFGKTIRNPKSSLMQQAESEAKFVGHQFEPISVSQMLQDQKKHAPLEQQAERFFGITPAPKQKVGAR